MHDTIIILMKYDEPEWKETFECAYKTGCPILIADRAGVGSMSEAYNRTFRDNYPLIKQYKYVWFVSNIIFSIDDYNAMKRVLKNHPDVSCIHPCFDSDHKHLQPQEGNSDISEVPYVEFTAPMMPTWLFSDFPLDEDMPFVGNDLDWSFRVKKAKYRLFVHYGVTVEHTYIRKNVQGHDVTDIRRKIRKSWQAHTEDALIGKYGVNWRKVLKYDGAV